MPPDLTVLIHEEGGGGREEEDGEKVAYLIFERNMLTHCADRI